MENWNRDRIGETRQALRDSTVEEPKEPEQTNESIITLDQRYLKAMVINYTRFRLSDSTRLHRVDSLPVVIAKYARIAFGVLWPYQALAVFQ